MGGNYYDAPKSFQILINDQYVLFEGLVVLCCLHAEILGAAIDNIFPVFRFLFLHIVKRGFYYCGRMVSEQYGTVFTDEHYEKLEKVYSIWICPDPAKKRKNGIFKYHTVEDIIYGESYTKEKNYDLMEVVVLNLGDADKSSDLEILDRCV